MLQRNRYNATDVIAPMMPIYQQLISGGHGLKILVREGATLEYPGVPRSTPGRPSLSGPGCRCQLLAVPLHWVPPQYAIGSDTVQSVGGSGSGRAGLLG